MVRKILISVEFVVLFLPSSFLLLYAPLMLYSGGKENLTNEIGAAIGAGIFLIGCMGVCGLYVAQNLAAHVISSSAKLYSLHIVCAGLMAGMVACVFAIWAYSNWYTSTVLSCPIVGAVHLMWMCRYDLLAT